MRRRAAEEAFKLVAEKVQRVEAESHASKLEEEQILAKLEAARRNAAVEAQARAEQERRIKEEIEMFRRLEDEERPRLEALILQRSQAETRLQQQRERFKSEEEARVRAEEQIETLREYSRSVVEPQVQQFAEDTVDIAEPAVSAGEAQIGAATLTSVETSAEPEAAPLDAEIPAAADIPPAIASYLHSVDPYKRAAAVAELARSQAKDAFALIARCFDDHSPHVRNAAARSLFNLNTDRAATFTRAAAGEIDGVRVHQMHVLHDRPYLHGAFGDRLRHVVAVSREFAARLLALLGDLVGIGEPERHSDREQVPSGQDLFAGVLDGADDRDAEAALRRAHEPRHLVVALDRVDLGEVGTHGGGRLDRDANFGDFRRRPRPGRIFGQTGGKRSARSLASRGATSGARPCWDG